jgi:hypothetical protein
MAVMQVAAVGRFSYIVICVHGAVGLGRVGCSQNG